MTNIRSILVWFIGSHKFSKSSISKVHVKNINKDCSGDVAHPCEESNVFGFSYLLYRSVLHETLKILARFKFDLNNALLLCAIKQCTEHTAHSKSILQI